MPKLCGTQDRMIAAAGPITCAFTSLRCDTSDQYATTSA